MQIRGALNVGSKSGHLKSNTLHKKLLVSLEWKLLLIEKLCVCLQTERKTKVTERHIVDHIHYSEQILQQQLQPMIFFVLYLFISFLCHVCLNYHLQLL